MHDQPYDYVQVSTVAAFRQKVNETRDQAHRMAQARAWVAEAAQVPEPSDERPVVWSRLSDKIKSKAPRAPTFREAFGIPG